MRSRDRVAGAGLRLGALGALIATALALTACARNDQPAPTPRSMTQTWSPRVVEHGRPVPRGGGHYKTGAPYQVKGQWFFPREEPGYDRRGIASWYGTEFHGRKTANGEVFDMDALTAAHPTLPMPSYVLVTNLDNQRTLLVRVNDRGPYAHDRVIDLSRMVARLLGIEARGTGQVRVKYLGPAPLDGDDNRERRHLAMQPWYSPALASAPRVPVPLRGASHPSAGTWRPSAAAAGPGPAARPPAPAREPQPVASTSPGGRRVWVQAGVFRSRENAERLKAELATAGPAVAEPVAMGGQMGWRVRVGPVAEGAPASLALARALEAGAVGARIVAE